MGDLPSKFKFSPGMISEYAGAVQAVRWQLKSEKAGMDYIVHSSLRLQRDVEGANDQIGIADLKFGLTMVSMGLFRSGFPEPALVIMYNKTSQTERLPVPMV
jgi:hypothetical protein